MHNNLREGGKCVARQYVYKGQDVTMDILMKTEQVVSLIANRDQQSFDDALVSFSASRTYQNLQNTETILWAESAEFIADEYEREMNAQ